MRWQALHRVLLGQGLLGLRREQARQWRHRTGHPLLLRPLLEPEPGSERPQNRTHWHLLLPERGPRRLCQQRQEPP